MEKSKTEIMSGNAASEANVLHKKEKKTNCAVFLFGSKMDSLHCESRSLQNYL